MRSVKNLITIDKQIVSGTPVFKGTRVPVRALFTYMRKGYPLDEFFIDFPSVSKEHAQEVIAVAARIMTSDKLSKLYEAFIRRKPSGKVKKRSA